LEHIFLVLIKGILRRFAVRNKLLRSPSIPLKKGEEENLIYSPPFLKGAGGDLCNLFKGR